MSKLIYIILAALLLSCGKTGPQGPAGTDGAPGTNGNNANPLTSATGSRILTTYSCMPSPQTSTWVQYYLANYSDGSMQGSCYNFDQAADAECQANGGSNCVYSSSTSFTATSAGTITCVAGDVLFIPSLSDGYVTVIFGSTSTNPNGNLQENRATCTVCTAHYANDSSTTAQYQTCGPWQPTPTPVPCIYENQGGNIVCVPNN